MKFWRRCFRTAVLVLVIPFGCAWWWDDGGDLDRLIVNGLRNNPRLARQWRELEKAKFAGDAAAAFRDVRLYSRAGHAGDPDGAEHTRLETGATAPLAWGAYLDAGFEADVFVPAAAGDSGQSRRGGARIGWRIPLWRDRGFRQLILDERRAEAGIAAARGAWLAEAQGLRREITLAYLDILERRELLRIADSALERAVRLRTDAEEMARLQAIPAYQTAAAGLEAALRREERLAAAAESDVAGMRLAGLLGAGPGQTPPLAADAGRLLDWALRAPQAAALEPGDIAALRGDRRRNAAEMEDARLARLQAADRRRADLALETVWRYRDGDSGAWPASGTRNGERGGAWEAALAWSRPWGMLAETAEKGRYTAALDALRERERELEIENRAAREAAVRRYESAGARLGLVTEAVKAAEQALLAETERFRFGEGRSRDVLDAQKDLNDALRRQVLVAANLLRAAADLHYNLGFPKEMPPAQNAAAAAGAPIK